MKNRSKEAVELFQKGAGCAQAVVAAHADLVGLDFDTAMKVSCALSGGVSRLREVCGAVSGMAIIAGMLDGNTEPADIESRTKAYARVQRMSELFRARFGSVVCRDILGKTGFEKSPLPTLRDAAFYDNRPCVDCIRFAAEILAGGIAGITERGELVKNGAGTFLSANVAGKKTRPPVFARN